MARRPPQEVPATEEGSIENASDRDVARPRKIKRSWPLLIASCVLLVLWFVFLGAIAWPRVAN